MKESLIDIVEEITAAFENKDFYSYDLALNKFKEELKDREKFFETFNPNEPG